MATKDASKDTGSDVSIPMEELDDEEVGLRAELAAQKAQGRKLRLKAEIAALKVQNEDLEAGGQGHPGGPKGPGVGPNLGPPPLGQPGPVPAQAEKDSKYSIHRFLPKLDKVRSANFQELLYGALQWAIQSGLVEGVLLGYLQHLSYICFMTASGIYPPLAAVEYDLAVRENADVVGMSAFGPSDSHLTNCHFGVRSMASQTPTAPAHPKKKAAATPAKTQAPMTGADNACLLFNYEESCPKGQKCRFPHICRNCGGDHKAKSCKSPK